MEVSIIGLIVVLIALVAGLDMKLTKLQKTVNEIKSLMEKTDEPNSN